MNVFVQIDGFIVFHCFQNECSLSLLSNLWVLGCKLARLIKVPSSFQQIDPLEWDNRDRLDAFSETSSWYFFSKSTGTGVD